MDKNMDKNMDNNDTISRGFQLYANIRNFIGLFILSLFTLLALVINYKIFKQKYILSKKAYITETGKSKFLNYTVNGKLVTIILPLDNKSKVGPISLYYSSKYPKNFSISSIHPMYIALIMLLVVLFLLFLSIGNIYLTRKYKTLGTEEGELYAVGDIMNVLK
jgi:hypothetical protein